MKYRGIRGSSLSLDISSFQTGVYFITVSSGDFVTTRKVVKD
ncbi:MAG: T9SS type A sorting domain-containing protein [Bacteroidales bacterium]